VILWDERFELIRFRTAGHHAAPGREESDADAILSRDSWWTDWGASLEERSGDRRPAPQRLGHRRYKMVEAAPGEYELET
jgi:polyhydroxyalkanoate synthase